MQHIDHPHTYLQHTVHLGLKRALSQIGNHYSKLLLPSSLAFPDSYKRKQPVIQLIMNSKPYVSRYVRKQNYQSLNYPSPTPSPPAFSPHHAPVHELSGQKRTSLQQRQIEQLQQKVDLILQHNQKLTLTNHLLQAENEELKHRQLDDFAHRQRISRYQIEDNETLRRVRSELQMKTKELELLGRDYEAAKEAGRREAEGLRLVIGNLNASLDQAKIDAIRLQQEQAGLREQAETDRRMAVKEAERRVQEEWSRSQRDMAEQAAREQAQQRRVLQELSLKFQQQRAEWQSRKNALVAKLQDNHNREIAQLREEMASQFQIELNKLAEEAAERCRNEREKAEQFVRDSLQGDDTAGQLEAETMRSQIAGLQSSLDQRRRLIAELASSELQRECGRDGLAETLLVRRRLKEQVESLLRENQTLKIKTAQKYDRDLREMVRVYQDRIDVLSKQNDYLTGQNARLRSNYQAQVANKVAMRRAWQVQAGQLRNLVRKLKVELRGIEDEFKLNIQGIKDQNLTFSMSLMKSMVQDRDKANFFQDENRKLRSLYTRHEADLEQERNQAQEKVAFYKTKYDQLKNSLDAERADLAQKERLIQQKLDARQRAISEANRAERQHLAQLIEEWENEKEHLEKQLQAATERAETVEAEVKELKQQTELLRSKLKENGEHIQRLRLQLQMAGVDDHEKEDVVNHWKQHYEGIILKLQGDKHELKTAIDTANGKIEQLVYRYRTLENELQKATTSLERRGEVDQRVIELGLDHNLVKNMAEVWSRPTI